MKKIFKIILFAVSVLIICSRLISIMNPINILNITYNDITDSLENYNLNDKTLSEILNDENSSYMVVRCDIAIKSNNKNLVFLEDLKCKMPFSYLYYEDKTEFYDQYELNPYEEDHFISIYVIEHSNRKKEDIIRLMEANTRVGMFYWVYINKIPLFAWQ